MSLVTTHDFESLAGKQKIITTIQLLERKVHELERALNKVTRAEDGLESDLQGPEAY